MGLSKLCYLDEMAADEQTEFKSGVCVLQLSNEPITVLRALQSLLVRGVGQSE